MGLASQPPPCSDFEALPTLGAHQERLLRAHTDEPKTLTREVCTCVSPGRFQGWGTTVPHSSPLTEEGNVTVAWTAA